MENVDLYLGIYKFNFSTYLEEVHILLQMY